MLGGRHPYHDATPGISTWPPFFWSIAVPLALAARLSPHATRVLWLAAGWLALYWALACLTRLVHGRRLTFAGESSDDSLPLASAAVLVPLLLTLRYVLSNFEHLQVNVLIFALVACGLLLITRGRDSLGGLAIGMAAALKVMPALFVPYFLWRGRLRAAGWTLLWAAVLSLAPAAVFGPARYADYVGAWREAVAAGWGTGRMNQSVYAMLDRLVGHGLIPLAASVNELGSSGNPAVTALFASALAAALLLAALTFRGPTPGGSGDRRMLAEFSVVLLIAAVFGTVSWKAYLVVLLLPNMLLFAAWSDQAESARTRRALRVMTLTAFGLGIAASDALVGRPMAARLETASVETWAALLLLGTLFWYRGRAGPPQL